MLAEEALYNLDYVKVNNVEVQNDLENDEITLTLHLIIDEDNYDRFAALVISDLSAGPLRDAAVNGGDMLLVGAVDPLHMTKEERENQEVRVVSLDALGGYEK